MKWGIIGYGEITPNFIKALAALKEEDLVAIASVNKSTFLKKENSYPGTIIYSAYNDLLNDTEINIIYISTTNNLHKENVLNALRAGKHVLCEKPLAICKADAEEMILEAKRQNKFLMEGMWTRFLPAYRYFKSLLVQKEVGEVNFVRVDFGFRSTWGKERRLLNKDLNGGVILDNTDYNVFLCQDIFQAFPSKISALGRFTTTGVEDTCAATFQYPNGALAQLFSSFNQLTRQEVLIYGEKGHIRLTEFWHGTVVELFKGEHQEKWEFPFRSTGFEYEIEEVVSCIQKGKTESDLMTHEMSLEVAEIMDIIINEVNKKN
jgi:predicted dehydrogenase